jgi:hypothetical protein
MDFELYQKLVWTDFRLAVLLTVIVPFLLLIWSFISRNEMIQRLLIIYWRVSSLLAITVYLMIAALPISYITGTLARILIPLSLWFWVDLNTEIDEQPTTGLKRSLTIWRWAITAYCSLGVLFQLSSLRCAFVAQSLLVGDRFCRVWLDPAWGYKLFLHAGYRDAFLGFLGIAGLIIYVCSLGYFVFFRLGRQGRSAIQL